MKPTLQEIVNNAPESKALLFKEITAENVKRPAKTFMESFDFILRRTDVPLDQIPLYTYLREAERKGYIRICNQKARLIPIRPEHSYLVHTAILDDRAIESLAQRGVYGDPDTQGPTYLSNPEWRGVSYVEGETGENNSKLVILTVDIQRLLSKRTLFADPEAINENVFRPRVEAPFYNFNELGDMFFVCGGIPKEAIKKISPKYTINKMEPIDFF